MIHIFFVLEYIPAHKSDLQQVTVVYYEWDNAFVNERKNDVVLCGLREPLYLGS